MLLIPADMPLIFLGLVPFGVFRNRGFWPKLGADLYAHVSRTDSINEKSEPHVVDIGAIRPPLPDSRGARFISLPRATGVS